MDKIEKIKAEIEHLRREVDDHNYYLDNSEQAVGYGLALDDIEKFLNTLSEEPDKSLEEEIETWIPAHISIRTDETLPINPTELAETCKEWGKCIARHFAKWGAEHSGSSEMPKDLEAYAQSVEDYYDVGEERGYLCTHRGNVKDAVITGAKWQKQQMLKDAIHYVVQDDLDSHGASYSIPFIRIGTTALKPKGIGVGDKVKVIVLKEEEE